jgi:bifunctional UDP-N-acetylglucosamine pyrophosphorylase/glucosamine-1-phosphate N-acetyltransferase
MTNPEESAAVAAIILGAGKGTRMKSERAKVLHEVDGRPMIRLVVDAAMAAGCDPVVAVIGHQREQVREALGDDVLTAVQEEQLGTGHAVRCAREALDGFVGFATVLSGDVPLIRAETIRALTETAVREDAACALLSMEVTGENRYGKVVRGSDGAVERIVEHKDATPEQRKITEVNAGVYAFRLPELFEALARVSNENAQGEYYLPDVIEQAVDEKKKVVAVLVDDAAEVMGVDTVEALTQAEKRFAQRRQDGVQGTQIA